MSDCGKCLHVDVCKTADSCDGKVPNCKHFLQNGTLLPVTCKLGDKGCFGEGKCWYKKDCENKVVTHADKLRAMSDEELAKFLLCADQGNVTVDVCDEKYCTPDRCPGDCTSAINKWLRSPAEEDAP